MCLIAHRSKPGTHIPNKVIDHNAKSNPDGFGLMWRDGTGRTHSKKWGPADFADFRAALKKLDKSNVEYAAHWRLATHGPVCQSLSHPFAYEDPEAGETLVMHNGIIDGLVIPKSESDTSAFVSGVLAKLPARWYSDPNLTTLVGMAIGWSRLLVMAPDVTVRLNAGWVEEGGVTYSTKPIPKATAYAWGKWSGSAKASAAVFDDETDAPDDEPLLLGPGKPDTDWYDMGHQIVSLSDEDWGMTGDRLGTARCLPCDLKGDWYRINGELYIDMKHKVTE